MTVVLENRAGAIQVVPIAVDPEEVDQSRAARDRSFASWSDALAFCAAGRIIVFNEDHARAMAALEARCG